MYDINKIKSHFIHTLFECVCMCEISAASDSVSAGSELMVRECLLDARLAFALWQELLMNGTVCLKSQQIWSI